MDKKRLNTILSCARNWIKEYAPEQYKFNLNEKAPEIKLSEQEKTAVKEIVKLIKKTKKEGEIAEGMRGIINEQKLNPREFFPLIYKILFNKDRGPKLAQFISLAEKSKILNLLEQALS